MLFSDNALFKAFSSKKPIKFIIYKIMVVTVLGSSEGIKWVNNATRAEIDLLLEFNIRA